MAPYEGIRLTQMVGSLPCADDLGAFSRTVWRHIPSISEGSLRQEHSVPEKHWKG